LKTFLQSKQYREAGSNRVGIYGGTFDPIHNVHLKIANCAVTQLQLDRLYFIPNFIPPHKLGKAITPVCHRVKMIQAVVRSNPKFRISRYEIARKRLSFTVDTLRHFRKRFPSSEFFLIIGSDMLCQFEAWKEPEEILKLSTLAVYERAGQKIPEHCRYGFYRLRGAKYSLSATEIRHSRAQGGNVSAVVPKAVWRYIKAKKLYVHSTGTK
jgi:nicotinate-nucleotide adenylyltransferase